VQTAEVLAGETTSVAFELPPAGLCPVTVTSDPNQAEVYLDYIPTGQLTDVVLAGIGYGKHDVTVRRSGYLLPPPQTVELSASTCATSVHFALVEEPPTATPTPGPTATPTAPPPPPPTPTPFPGGLKVWLNNAALRPGDTFEVAVSFTDSVIDFDGYMVIVRSDGRAWSILQGNRLVEALLPIVADAMEIHYPWGPVTVLRMQVPYGVPGYYAVYGAILPPGTPPTLQNARGPFSQLDIEPFYVSP
jgi:hypothetical protein